MKRTFVLGMLIVVGFVWSGCRENAVGPMMVGNNTPPMADTLSKHGTFGGGDTLSGLRNAESVLPAPRSEPGAAGKRTLKEDKEQTVVR